MNWAQAPTPPVLDTQPLNGDEICCFVISRLELVQAGHMATDLVYHLLHCYGFDVTKPMKAYVSHTYNDITYYQRHRYMIFVPVEKGVEECRSLDDLNFNNTEAVTRAAKALHITLS